MHYAIMETHMDNRIQFKISNGIEVHFYFYKWSFLLRSLLFILFVLLVKSRLDCVCFCFLCENLERLQLNKHKHTDPRFPKSFVLLQSIRKFKNILQNKRAKLGFILESLFLQIKFLGIFMNHFSDPSLNTENWNPNKKQKKSTLSRFPQS